MIALAPRSAKSRSAEEIRHSQEQLRTIMTERVRRWMMQKALQWFEGDWDRAADLVQNTFLALLRTKSYDPAKCSPITYAYARLRGLRSHCYRDEANRQSRSCSLNFDPLATREVDPLERQETIAQVATALDHLQPRDAVIILDYFSDVSTTETGRKFGVSRQCISQRRPKALDSLQNIRLPVPA